MAWFLFGSNALTESDGGCGFCCEANCSRGAGPPGAVLAEPPPPRGNAWLRGDGRCGVACVESLLAKASALWVSQRVVKSVGFFEWTCARRMTVVWECVMGCVVQIGDGAGEAGSWVSQSMNVLRVSFWAWFGEGESLNRDACGTRSVSDDRWTCGLPWRGSVVG